mmetsp:Transcript_5979/g.21083  ORF Transcript_5979/g.21083 Transcript_5979/m.21083 type:complete len:103 (+) Transcript_5979:290-598(+)
MGRMPREDGRTRDRKKRSRAESRRNAVSASRTKPQATEERSHRNGQDAACQLRKPWRERGNPTVSRQLAQKSPCKSSPTLATVHHKHHRNHSVHRLKRKLSA